MDIIEKFNSEGLYRFLEKENGYLRKISVYTDGKYAGSFHCRFWSRRDEEVYKRTWYHPTQYVEISEADLDDDGDYQSEYRVSPYDVFERIERVDQQHAINARLLIGWKILDITHSYHAPGEPFPVAIMGVPREQYCYGGDRFYITYGTIGGEAHKRHIKNYDLETDKWYCIVCAQSIVDRNLGMPHLTRELDDYHKPVFKDIVEDDSTKES